MEESQNRLKMKRTRESALSEVLEDRMESSFNEVPENRAEKVQKAIERVVESQAQMVMCVGESQIQLLACVSEVLEKYSQTQAQLPRNETMSRLGRDFLRLGAPSFDGTPDPVIADSWISEMEKIFNVTECNDHQKVVMAVFMLKGEAYHWWIMTKGDTFSEQIDWQRFRQLFLDKYFPEYVREKYYYEFLNLTQGSMSVDQYDARFLKLWHLSLYYLTRTDPEEVIARQFERGLKPSIRSKLVILKLRKLADVLDRARIVEMAEEMSRVGNQRTRRATNRQQFQNVERQAPLYNEQHDQRPQEAEQEQILLPNGFEQQEQGVRGPARYFRRRNLGHMRRSCPNQAGASGSANTETNEEVSDGLIEDDEVEWEYST